VPHHGSWPGASKEAKMYAMTIKGRSIKELTTVVQRTLTK
jgi:hypothetical protein